MVEEQALYYSEFFPWDTIVDPFMNEQYITITDAPRAVVTSTFARRTIIPTPVTSQATQASSSTTSGATASAERSQSSSLAPAFLDPATALSTEKPTRSSTIIEAWPPTNLNDITTRMFGISTLASETRSSSATHYETTASEIISALTRSSISVDLSASVLPERSTILTMTSALLIYTSSITTPSTSITALDQPPNEAQSTFFDSYPSTTRAEMVTPELIATTITSSYNSSTLESPMSLQTSVDARNTSLTLPDLTQDVTSTQTTWTATIPNGSTNSSIGLSTISMTSVQTPSTSLSLGNSSASWDLSTGTTAAQPTTELLSLTYMNTSVLHSTSTPSLSSFESFLITTIASTPIGNSSVVNTTQSTSTYSQSSATATSSYTTAQAAGSSSSYPVTISSANMTLSATTPIYLNSTTSTTISEIGTKTNSITNPATTSSTSTATAQPSVSVNAKVLVIVRSAQEFRSAAGTFNGYGIPTEPLLVPRAGAVLPNLNSTTGGNYGGIVMVGQVAYDFGGIFRSALSPTQWQQLYEYQKLYGVRMVQLDVYPGPDYGVLALGGCCAAGVEQSIFLTAVQPQTGIRTAERLSTKALYHYPAVVTNSQSTQVVAKFEAGSGFAESVAAVVHTADGKQQMVFFIAFAMDFSPTSHFLAHEYITWMTRGLYLGYRRVHLNTQVAEMFSATPLYSPNGASYRVVPADMHDINNWIPTINAKLNSGSFYMPEIGHVGNGNIEHASRQTGATCEPITYVMPSDQTPLEYKKPLGTGSTRWPISPTVYGYSTSCVSLDPLRNWWNVFGNRDRFMHVSNTFTTLSLNNATYSDALKEIQFNQAWLQQQSLASSRFSPTGLISPNETGLHNGDVMRAWANAGLRHVTGDNTRPVLRNTQNDMWAYTTTLAADGFDGFSVLPIFKTRIYRDCDTPACTTQKWINTSAGAGSFNDLLEAEKTDTIRRLFGLYHDGYTFAQANLRRQGLAPITINGIVSPFSIFQAWVETVAQEFVRLANWPIISISQSDLAESFRARELRDKCNARLVWLRDGNGTITGVEIGTVDDSHVCSTRIPLTIPFGKTVRSLQGFQTEKVGLDPLTIWVDLTGQKVRFDFVTGIATSA